MTCRYLVVFASSHIRTEVHQPGGIHKDHFKRLVEVSQGRLEEQRKRSEPQHRHQSTNHHLTAIPQPHTGHVPAQQRQQHSQLLTRESSVSFARLIPVTLRSVVAVGKGEGTSHTAICIPSCHIPSCPSHPQGLSRRRRAITPSPPPLLRLRAETLLTPSCPCPERPLETHPETAGRFSAPGTRSSP